MRGSARYVPDMKSETPLPREILLIDKPEGMSSFDVIRVLRRNREVRKMGHAGTLDPLASGLLIVGVGEGTKKLSDYLKLPKRYEADIGLGMSTATGDREGPTVAQAPAPDISETSAKEILAGITGILSLPVPRYSAIKKNGAPLYVRTRRGENVSPPVREMQVDRAEFCGIRRKKDMVILSVVLDVGSGTYIRSVAEEIGRRLGVPAMLWKLRRTRIGSFDIRHAEKI